MMGIGKDGVAAPGSARVKPGAGRQLSPAALVVAALACGAASAFIGSMLSVSTDVAAEYGARLTAEAPSRHR